ncbi:UDP-N-acetylglucosamine 2-epimerase (non-hydrolyzing) [Flavobacterium sp. FBOR7N2.3]|uniref:UDP-N-acetylglucosamine 2-epimerase (non-hydrolyzing) n=1 Tax=Flavobacterium magnesitis TaxID=3138077 RepID=A0ABV4TL87_9FLAO
MKILLCFGTRPEAIKMAPVFHKLKDKGFEVKICVTAQHREMLDQVLLFFEIKPDYDLNLMKSDQTLNGLSASILEGIDSVLVAEKPDLILVHGDTTTSSMVALAGFNRNINVGHIEAGLRTYNKTAPFPEEINRQITSRLADLHFTPTLQASQNLINEGVLKETIFQTGNTVIDALFWTLKKIEKPDFDFSEIKILKEKIDQNKKIILVTGHRRENFGTGFQNICEAILQLAKREDVQIVYPVHLNPNVKKIVEEKLSRNKNILLVNPVSYPAFVWLMQQSFLIMTDSGGIQEEAPSLGKPVIVTRTVSERPEGVIAGYSKLVGHNQEMIIESVIDLIENFKGFENIANPYGNGDASEQIVNALLK